MEEPYYLANFQCVLRDVQARYGDLLLPAELERLEGFLALPWPARCLYVRMLTRKGPWFRLEGLAYPEVGDPGPALAILASTGFAGLAATAADRVALLRKDELEALLREAGLPARKTEARGTLADRVLAAVPEARLEAAVTAASPLGGAWARLLFMLFFGNREQDLTAFLLADLGRVRYEDYPVDARCRLFQSREEVAFLFSMDDLRAAFEAGEDLEGVTRALLAMEPHPGIRCQRRCHRLLNDLGRAWERRGAADTALACYARSRIPPARERTVRLLMAREAHREAADVALLMAGAPLDPGEERLARRFLERLGPRDLRASAWLQAHPPDPPVPSLRLRTPRHPSGSVELAALEASGWPGWHTENTLWTALYGLAFWDVLFAPVPGAFQHRFQGAPADLRTPDFFTRRREAIEARLRDLEEPAAARRLILAASGKRGVANAFVHWAGLPQELLETALDTLPHAALLAVLRTMAPNPAAFRSGFPDLFLFREGRCKVWEVKGPGDVLRPEQERWLARFTRAGLEASVVWVTYSD